MNQVEVEYIVGCSVNYSVCYIRSVKRILHGIFFTFETAVIVDLGKFVV